MYYLVQLSCYSIPPLYKIYRAYKVEKKKSPGIKTKIDKPFKISHFAIGMLCYYFYNLLFLCHPTKLFLSSFPMIASDHFLLVSTIILLPHVSYLILTPSLLHTVILSDFLKITGLCILKCLLFIPTLFLSNPFSAKLFHCSVSAVSNVLQHSLPFWKIADLPISLAKPDPPVCWSNSKTALRPQFCSFTEQPLPMWIIFPGSPFLLSVS